MGIFIGENMKLIAQRGNQLLIQTNKDRGFVYDKLSNERFEENNIHSIIARGYWEEPTIKMTKGQLQAIKELPVTT